MATSHYLLLLSMNKDSAVAAKAFLTRIKTSIDANASPQWIDSKGIGIFISTELKAWQIMKHAWPDNLTRDQIMDLNDFLIVQVGPDWYGPSETKASAWLNGRFPRH